MDYKYRKYCSRDKKFVYEVKKEAYKVYVEKNWGEWVEKDQLMRFQQFIKDGKENIKIIIVNNRRIGFVQCGKIDNGFEIENICIIPKYQNLGIGSSILKEIIAEHGKENIYLQFFKDNRVGNLYKRLGFEFFEELPYHIKMVRRAGK